MKNHILCKHLGGKPFKCGNCDYSTDQKFNLNRHLKVCLSNNKPTAEERQSLLKKAKKFSVEHDFPYLWLRNDQIFLKKTEQSKVFEIRRDEDFAIVLKESYMESVLKESL